MKLFPLKNYTKWPILPRGMAFFSRNFKNKLKLSILLGSVSAISSCLQDPDPLAIDALERAEQSPLAIYSALESNNEALALAILDSKVRQDKTDEEGRTPLMLAAQNRQPRAAWSFLHRDANLHRSDHQGRTAIIYAAEANENWLVRELLKRGENADAKVSSETPLISKCLGEGKLAIVQTLLEFGADLNSTNQEGETLIQIASKNGHVWLVEDLIEKGAEVNNRGVGEPLVHIAAQTKEPRLLDVLAERDIDFQILNHNGESALHTAVGSGSANTIPALVKYGVSLNRQDPHGCSPLHYAVMRRDKESLTTLLRLGAEVNTANKQGRTPLALSLEQSDYEFAQILRHYDASFETADLLNAVTSGDRELIDFLLNNEADPNAHSKLQTDTPLGAAVRKGDSWSVHRLLKAGALPSAHAAEGQSAFHLAVARLDLPLVRAMLENGANPNIPFNDYPSEEFLEQVASPNIAKSAMRSSRSFAPIALASDAGNVEIAKLLLDYGAKTDTYTRGGRYNYWAPISWAARRADIPMMQTLLGRNPDNISRRAKIDLSQQRAWVYEGDEQIYSTRVSTGKAGHRTKTGKFVITNRYRHWNSTIYGSSMPYFQRFSCGDFGFHQGNVPGYPASHGCVRVPYGNVRKLWSLLSLGDPVTIVP